MTRPQSSLWIVHRRLPELLALPDAVHTSGPDTSIISWAMAEFIQFSSALPGMPTIVTSHHGDQLRDGRRLLGAAQRAGYDQPVACLYRTTTKSAPHGAQPFTQAAAEKLGTDARVIALRKPATPLAKASLRTQWSVPPAHISERSFGWSDADAKFALPTWLDWIHEVEEFSLAVADVLAVNGRYAAWLPTEHRAVGP